MCPIESITGPDGEETSLAEDKDLLHLNTIGKYIESMDTSSSVTIIYSGDNKWIRLRDVKNLIDLIKDDHTGLIYQIEGALNSEKTTLIIKRNES